ncbi:hypothetical protein AC477_04265 [miscellaneous Crenarchaeota group-1 archaeon SG8-32-1]|uniref:DUF4234 domain-containing protein n=1 Tax=miscellaneous Crenarchaeota group-1 archaeon SG8-32-1 TaxID=1685124 RepID=A0A0M0BS84_9ARCH|nr:MAG: hypothetical protein AC477_04265 [miscellaneous Crenarchaeota group-1 archaeon SG8-32-1]
MNKILLKIEQNIASRKETDKIMWFSMWAILSVASFGIAWFPMIYYLLKRRNAHFLRQEKLEELILNKLRERPSPEKIELDSKSTKPCPQRNETLWIISTLLIIPAFYVFYFLKSDLQKHEEHEQFFLNEVNTLGKDTGVPLNIQSYATTPRFPIAKYVVFSVVTLGLATAYWLYQIFNDYNNHFKMQWIIEDELFTFLKELEQKTS